MQIIAHRGFSGRYPENTMLGFKKARDLGVDGFEFDVQLCRDDTPVVIHDETVDRITNGSGKVADFTAQELKKFVVGRGERIPTLAEVLAEFSKGPRLVIELKCYQEKEYRRLVVESLKIIKKYHPIKSPLICSFHWETLQYLRQKDKDVAIGILHLKKTTEQVLAIAQAIQARALCTNVGELNSEIKEIAVANKWELFVWTVNNKAQAQKCRDLQVTAMIGNYPDLLMRYL